VRAGDRLTPEEIAALVCQRGRADHSPHCPHGRPTALLFTLHAWLRGVRQVVPVTATSKWPLVPGLRQLRVPDTLSGSMVTPGAAGY